MKLKDAYQPLSNLYYKPLTELTQDNFDDFQLNKGKMGQLLEKIIGLPNGSSLRDFEDGELKTNKSDHNGQPKETMFITQISRNFDSLLDSSIQFEETWLFKKIKNLIYLPVVKESTIDNWYFLTAHHINIEKNNKLLKQLTIDFNQIREKIRLDIKTSEDGFIHTSNGKYIQIRSKDSKPYRPIFSKKLNKEVSNKNHAFYFKKQFMQDIQSGLIQTKIINAKN